MAQFKEGDLVVAGGRSGRVFKTDGSHLFVQHDNGILWGYHEDEVEPEAPEFPAPVPVVLQPEAGQVWVEVRGRYWLGCWEDFINTFATKPIDPSYLEQPGVLKCWAEDLCEGADEILAVTITCDDGFAGRRVVCHYSYEEERS